MRQPVNDRRRHGLDIGGVDDRRMLLPEHLEIADIAGEHATDEELIDFCRQRLASFKVPRRVQFVEQWPMTGAGKIQRYVLKESLAQA